MNNWNVVIQDDEDEPESNFNANYFRHSIDHTDDLLNRFGSVHLDSASPPAKPARPPPEAIYKTSSELLQFLSVTDSVQPHTLLSNSTSLENMRSSLVGPRALPTAASDDAIMQPRRKSAVPPPVPPPRLSPRRMEHTGFSPSVPMQVRMTPPPVPQVRNTQMTPNYPAGQPAPNATPYPRVDEFDMEYEEDINESLPQRHPSAGLELPVLPPVELKQYEQHQRVASSIFDSTGVSIADDIDDVDYFDISENEPNSMIPPLTPTRSTSVSVEKEVPQLRGNARLPALAPMMDTPMNIVSDTTQSEEAVEKPLPKIPSKVVDEVGEYTMQEEPKVRLPDLPFSASFLRTTHFQACTSCRYLSEISAWCIKFNNWFPKQHISLTELESSLYLLFKFHCPQLSDIILEAIASDTLKSLLKSGTIKRKQNEDMVDFDSMVKASGILPLLRDCYSPMNHIFPTPYRCYSHCCTYERLSYTTAVAAQQHMTMSSNMILGSDWVSHWKLSKEQLEDISKRVQIQQSHIFDLIKSVRGFINAGNVVIEVFGEGFAKNKKYFGNENNLNWDKFYEDAFGTVKCLVDVTREELFEPLIQKLNEERKFITGVSEIVQAWLTKVQSPLIIYAEKRVPVYNLIKKESNLKYSKFTEWITRTNASVSRDYTAERLFSVQFLTFFTTFRVTLAAILKKTEESDPEYRSLSKVIRNLDLVIQKSDQTQDGAERKIVVNNLKSRLLLDFKENAETDLKLEENERQLFKVGPLIRKRDIMHRVLNDSTVTLILLDNYLLIAEETETDNGYYRVTETPIHTSCLNVETKILEESSHLTKSPKKNTSTDEDSYNFRVFHSTKHIFITFETDEIETRAAWLNAFMEVKMVINNKSLKFEPFSISVVADALLGSDHNDISAYKQLVAKNDNIMKAIEHLDPGLPAIAATSKINCFNRFKFEGKSYILLGTSSGIFISNANKPRDWRKLLELKSVTQVEVLEEFGLVFVLSDKTFSYYFLSAFMANNHIVGEKLSKRDVSFFKIGKQNGVSMIFFMKPKQSVSYFKVLIPILEKSTNKVESFQQYKNFYVPGECVDISIFNSTFVVHTKKNFEVMSLTIAFPQSIPDLESAMTNENMAELRALKKTMSKPSLRTLGMFKLINDKEFILVYNKFAIFVNKSGTISKNRLLRFTIKAQKAIFQKNLLVLANDHYIEIWYINNSDVLNYQLVQVIAAQNLKMVSDNGNAGIFSMTHPIYAERQLVLALDPRF